MKESRYNVWVDRDSTSYVFNGMSGALLRMSRDERRSVSRVLGDPAYRDCSPRLLEQMVHGRMLVGDDADEIGLLERRYDATRHDTSSFALTIVTSLGCNFDCPYCFEAKHPSIMKDVVRQALLRIVHDQLPTITSFHVTWYGGEPLVGKKPLLALSDEFIECCDRADVSYDASITTNGYLLDEETCVQLRDRRVSVAQVCLDGPPEIHDRMRPLVNGKGTFWRIVENLRHAVDYFQISVRMNVDTENIEHAEELMQILVDEGLTGKLSVYPGQIVGVDDGTPSPSSTYKKRCFSSPEFARAELEFIELATRYGFGGRSLPRPSGAPCTAVRKNELVVGSMGELYKCWENVGNNHEVIGNVWDYENMNGRREKWLKYDPFTDDECRGCIALPVCMGGCAHHSMDPIQHENRCDAFRYSYGEQVLQFVALAEENGTEAYLKPAELARRMDTR